MDLMGRLPLLRALSALVLVASLLLLARVPDCDSESCRMSRSARAACREMGLDCCKPSAERFAHASAQPQLPDLLLAPVDHLGVAGIAANAAIAGSRPAPRRTALLPAPAIVQGVGFYTLFAVFLI
jgi:hypothetical protein